MNPGKIKALLEWVGVLGVGECLDTLQQLSDGLHLSKIAALIEQKEGEETIDNVTQRWIRVKTCLERCYNTNISDRVNFDLIQTNADETEIAKVTMLCLCGGVMSTPKFVRAAMMLNEQLQYEVKEIVEALVGDSLSSVPSLISTTWASVLSQPLVQPQVLDYTDGKLQKTSTPVTPLSLPTTPAGRNQTQDIFTNSTANTSILNRFCSPVVNDATPRRGVSPLHRAIHSPVVANKIELHRKERRIRELERNLNEERYQRMDTETALSEKEEELTKANQSLQELQRKYNHLRRESRCMQDDLTVMSSIKQENMSLETKVGKLQLLMRELQEEQNKSKQLDELNSSLLEENQSLQTKLSRSEQRKQSYQQQAEQLRKENIQLQEQVSSLQKHQKQLETETARLAKELTDFGQAHHFSPAQRKSLCNYSMDSSMPAENMGDVIEMELRTQITQLQNDVDNFRGMITEQLQSIEKLDTELGDCRTELSEKTRQFESERSFFYSEKQQLLSQLEEKHRHEEELSSNLNSCIQSLDNVSSANKQLENEMMCLQNKVLNVESELVQERQQSSSLKETLSQQSIEFSERYNQLDVEKRDACGKLTEVSQRCEELQFDIKSVNSELDNVRSAKCELETEMSKRCEELQFNIISVNSDLEKLRSAKSELETEKEVLLTHCAGLESQLVSEKEALNEALTHQNDTYEKLKEHMVIVKGLQAEVQESASKLQELHEVNCQLETNHESLQSDCVDLKEQLESKIDSFKSFEMAAEERITMLNSEKLAVENEKQCLQEALHQAQKNSDVLTNKLQEVTECAAQDRGRMEQEISEQKCNVSKLESELSDCKTSLSLVESEKQRLDGEREALVTQCNGLASTLTSLQESKQTMEVEFAENCSRLTSEKSSLESEKQSLEMSLFEVRSSKDELQEVLTACKADVSDKTALVEELCREKEIFGTKCTELEHQVECGKQALSSFQETLKQRELQFENEMRISTEERELDRKLASETIEKLQQEKQQLQRESGMYEEKISSLTKEVSILKKTLDDSKASGILLTSQLEEAKMKVGSLEALSVAAKTEGESVENRLLELQSMYEQLMAEKVHYQTAAGEKQAACENATALVKEEACKNETLENENCCLRKNLEQLGMEFESRKERHDIEMQSLQGALNEREILVNELTMSLEAYKTNLKKAEDCNEELMEQKRELESHLLGAKESLRNLEVKFEKERSEYNDGSGKLRHALDEKSCELGTLQQEVSQYKTEVEALQAQLNCAEDLQNSLDQLLSDEAASTNCVSVGSVVLDRVQSLVNEKNQALSQCLAFKENILKKEGAECQLKEQLVKMQEKLRCLEDELYETQQSANLQLSQAQSEKNEVDEQMETLLQDREQLIIHSKQLAEENKTLLRNIESTRKAFDMEGEQCVILRGEVSSLKEEIDNAREALQASQKSVDDWETRAEAEAGLRTALEQQLQDAREDYELQVDHIRDDLARAVSTNKRLEDQCSNYAEKLELIEQQLIEAANKPSQDVEQAVECYRSRYQTMVEKCDDYLSKVKLLEKAVLEAQSVSEELQAEKVRCRKLETELSKAEQKIRELEQQLEEAEDIVFGLEEKLSDGIHASTIQESLNATQLHLSRQEESHAAELTAAKAQQINLETQLKQAGQFVEEVKHELEKLHNKILTIEGEKNSLDEENAELKSTLQDSDAQIIQLTSALNAANQKMSETQLRNSGDDRCTQLENKLLMSRKEVQQLEEQLASSRSRQAKLEEDIRSRPSSPSLEQGLKQELLEAHQREQDLEVEIDSYKSDLDNAKDRIEELISKVRKESGRNSMFEGQCAELQMQKSQYEGEVSELKGSLAQLEVEKEGLEDLMENYNRELTETKTTLSQVDQALRGITACKTGLEKKLAECQHQLAECRHQLSLSEDANEQQRESSTSIIQQLQEKMDAQQRELGASAQQFACMEKEGHQQLYEARHRNKVLEQQIASLTRKHDQVLKEEARLTDLVSEKEGEIVRLLHELEKYSSESRSLQKQLAETKANKANLEKKFGEAEKQFNKLREVAEKYKDCYNNKKELVAEVTREKDEAVKRAQYAEKQLHSELSAANSQLAETKSANKHLTDRNRSLEAQLEFANKQLISRPPDERRLTRSHAHASCREVNIDAEDDGGPLHSYDLRGMSSLGRSPSLPARLDQLRVKDGVPTPRRARRESTASLNSSQLSADSLSSGPMTRSRRASLEQSFISEGSATTVDSFNPTRTGNPIRGLGTLMAEDEPDDEIQWGRLSAIHQQHLSEETGWGRLSELQRRNTLCLPHLKTSYPVETQAKKLSEMTDDQLKKGEPATPQSDRVLRKRHSEANLEGTPDAKQKKVVTLSTPGVKLYPRYTPEKDTHSGDISTFNPSASHQPTSLTRYPSDSKSTKDNTPKKKRWGLRTPRKPVRKPSSQSENEDAMSMPPPSKDALAFSIGFTPKKISRLLPGSLGKKTADSSSTLKKPLGDINTNTKKKGKGFRA